MATPSGGKKIVPSQTKEKSAESPDQSSIVQVSVHENEPFLVLLLPKQFNLRYLEHILTKLKATEDHLSQLWSSQALIC